TAGANAKSYANMREAREGAFEECLLPFTRKFGNCLRRQLLPDFGNAKGLVVRFDYSKVPALEEDRNALYTRTALAFEKGIITLAEARSGLGKDALPGQEELFSGDDTAQR